MKLKQIVAYILEIDPSNTRAFKALERLHTVMRTGQPVHEKEIHAPAPSRPHELRFWRVSYHPHLLPDGTVHGVYLTLIDLTQSKETETALVESQHRFEAFMNTTPLVGFMKEFEKKNG